MTRPSSGNDVLSELHAAADDQALVRLSRSIRRCDTLDGFLVGVGRRWLLLAVLGDLVILNGYVAVRLTDVANAALRRAEVVRRPGTGVARAVAAGPS